MHHIAYVIPGKIFDWNQNLYEI